jgi:hypothetical protein
MARPGVAKFLSWLSHSTHTGRAMSAPTSRLSIDRSTQLPSINTFGDLSQFLREAVADEDSRQFSESMAQLAQHAESLIAALRADRRRETMAPRLMDMLTVLRDHRNEVVGMGLHWRALYEYAGYLQALNHFRVLIGQWLLHADPWDDELNLTAEDFALVTWRTLGEGMLLIDMYEQMLLRQDDAASAPAGVEEPQVQRALQWWQKLRR